jgi:polysaccharide export outer membrane protein
MSSKILFALSTTLLFLSNFTAAQDIASPAAPYRFGPGDQIIETVAGEKDYDFIATIDEDGKLEVPYAEKPIMARCMTERALRQELTDRLEKWFRNPQVNIRIERRSRPPATVYGEVNNPGKIEMMRKATLLEVIAFTGGLRDDAAGIVQVMRTQPPLCSAPDDKDNWLSDAPDSKTVPSRTYSLARMTMGDEESNPTIYPGDVIYVHKAAPVYMTGEVLAPQGIYLKDGGLSLQQAIAKVGGFKREAKTSQITIHRLKPGSVDQHEEIIANYQMIKKGQQRDIMLQPYDVVEVGMAKDSFAVAALKMALGAGKAGVSSLGTGIGLRVLY